jgi:predicted dehydrogenase
MGRAFLQGQPLGEALDQIREPTEPCQLTGRHVSQVRDATEGDKMVRTHGMKTQATDDDDIRIGFAHHQVAKDLGWLHGVPGEEFLLPQLGYALGGLLQVRVASRIEPRGLEQGRDRGGYGLWIVGHAFLARTSLYNMNPAWACDNRKVAMEPRNETKTRWGVLGVAKIALDKIIPAIQTGHTGRVVAIASRTKNKAEAAAARFSIPHAYGSYEELLADPEVDAIYIPLPNHLHVPWSIRALEAGKHVLCEKPIARDAAEASQLLAVRERTGLLVQEAAMVRTHPRWLGAREIVRSGRLGELRSVTGFFSYFNDSPANVRHQPNMGGGGLLDIGFYPITMSRFIFEAEPLRVMGLLEIDPRFGVDRLASAILEFPRGHAIFTCSTQLVPYQNLDILGTRGRVGVEIPWSMPHERPSRLVVQVDGGSRAAGEGVEEIWFSPCDQWGVQCDRFCEAIANGDPAPVPIEDAVANMRVMDAVFRSAQSGHWQVP